MQGHSLLHLHYLHKAVIVYKMTISHLFMPFPGCMKPESPFLSSQQPAIGLHVLSQMHVVKTSYKEFQTIHFYGSIQIQDT
jgi:hypothetical protein